MNNKQIPYPENLFKSVFPHVEYTDDQGNNLLTFINTKLEEKYRELLELKYMHKLSTRKIYEMTQYHPFEIQDYIKYCKTVLVEHRNQIVNEVYIINYFNKLINVINDECDGISDLVKIQFCDDVRKYQEFSIKQYNDDLINGTDKFCLKNFLNNYNTAINVFGLHSEITNSRKQFNELINLGWEIYNAK